MRFMRGISFCCLNRSRRNCTGGSFDPTLCEHAVPNQYIINSDVKQQNTSKPDGNDLCTPDVGDTHGYRARRRLRRIGSIKSKAVITAPARNAEIAVIHEKEVFFFS
ncbi:MAG: hypothetical protein IJK54_11560, partial [Clostridia bacterium]|nr:hypothetical protein [Clostridia bacterium]